MTADLEGDEVFYDENHYYLTAVETAYKADPLKLSKWLTNICPECDGARGDEDHELIEGTDLIAIGCQGYWIISPEAVGLPAGNWCDWRDDDMMDWKMAQADYEIFPAWDR